MLQKLTISKLRKTSKRGVYVVEGIGSKRDSCPLLTDLTFEDMTTIPSEILCSLVGRKIHTLGLHRFGTFTKEFASTAAARLVNLRSLSVNDTKELTNSRLARVLKGCSGLTSLNLSNCSMIGTDTVTNISLYCQNLIRLEIANISSYEDGFDDAFIQLTKNCTSIQDLTLEFVLIFDRSLIGILQNMKALVRLQCINCFELLGQGTVVPDPFAVSKLETATFKNCKNLTNVLNICQACPLLRVLDLASCCWLVYSAFTHILLHGRNLESLTLNSQRSYGRDLDIVAACNLPKLTVVNLSGCAITDEGLGYVCAICPNIKTLCIDNCWELTNEGLYNLGLHCPQLEILSMNKEQNISETGLVSAVTHARVLRVLAFSLELNMTHTALTALAHLNVKNLQTIAISGFKFSGLYIQALLTLLDSCPSLMRLYLDDSCSFRLMHSPAPCDEDDKKAVVLLLQRGYPQLDIFAVNALEKIPVLEM